MELIGTFLDEIGTYFGGALLDESGSAKRKEEKNYWKILDPSLLPLPSSLNLSNLHNSSSVARGLFVHE